MAAPGVFQRPGGVQGGGGGGGGVSRSGGAGGGFNGFQGNSTGFSADNAAQIFQVVNGAGAIREEANSRFQKASGTFGTYWGGLKYYFEVKIRLVDHYI